MHAAGTEMLHPFGEERSAGYVGEILALHRHLALEDLSCLNCIRKTHIYIRRCESEGGKD